MMTSLERVLTTLGHREPDRVPYFLPLTTHGARELGLGIREYFSKPAAVIEGQSRMQAKYGHDCLYPFHYAALETEAWGGETIFYDDGPPNAGEPILKRPEDILRLTVPEIAACPGLLRVLETIRGLKARHGDRLPIAGVVMSPFSLPVMQMGFEAYLRVLLERPELLARLLAVNEEFCVAWANAQLSAGAHLVVYFDPVSSPTILPRETQGAVGIAVAKRTLARIHGPAAIHYASGRSLAIADQLPATGAVAVGVSAWEDLATVKAAFRGRMTVVGNLNAIEMRRWSPRQTAAAVQAALAKAGPGGGFILCDNHGEIPWQVPEETLLAIGEAVAKWGAYPLRWIDGDRG